MQHNYYQQKILVIPMHDKEKVIEAFKNSDDPLNQKKLVNYPVLKKKKWIKS